MDWIALLVWKPVVEGLLVYLEETSRNLQLMVEEKVDLILAHVMTMEQLVHIILKESAAEKWQHLCTIYYWNWKDRNCKPRKDVVWLSRISSQRKQLSRDLKVLSRKTVGVLGIRGSIKQRIVMGRHSADVLQALYKPSDGKEKNDWKSCVRYFTGKLLVLGLGNAVANGRKNKLETLEVDLEKQVHIGRQQGYRNRLWN